MTIDPIRSEPQGRGMSAHIDPALQPRGEGEPLSRVEAAVFGPDAKLHGITNTVLEQGSGALPDDAQARGHFSLMVSQLQRMVDAHKVEGDPLIKERIRAEHEAYADRIVGITEKLIEAKIVGRTALAAIPQLT
jgi:hypothetical protein